MGETATSAVNYEGRGYWLQNLDKQCRTVLLWREKRIFCVEFIGRGKIPGMTRAEKSRKRKYKPLTNPLLPFCPGLNCIRYLPLDIARNSQQADGIRIFSPCFRQIWEKRGGEKERIGLAFFCHLLQRTDGGGQIFPHSPGDPIFPSFFRLEKIQNKSAEEGKKGEGKRKDLSRW